MIIPFGFMKTSVASEPLDPDAFITSWNIVADSEELTYPIYANSSAYYNCTVDWGDGSTTDFIGNGDTITPTHTYATAGVYDVSVTGTDFGGVYVYNNAIMDTKLLEIKNWGTMNFSTALNFRGCTNMTVTATDIPDISGSPAMSHLFRDCNAITSIPNIGSWNLTGITSLSYWFNNCYNLEEGSLNGIVNWDVSSVTQMTYTFFNTASSWDVSLGGWNISSMTGDFSTWNSGTSAWSPANYDATLIGWADNVDADIPDSMNFDAGGSNNSEGYVKRTTASQDAYDFLTGTLGAAGTGIYTGQTSPGWTITDHGLTT